MLLVGPSVEALREWLERIDITKGPIFRAIDRWEAVEEKALTRRSINLILKRRCAMVGLEPVGVFRARTAHRISDRGGAARNRAGRRRCSSPSTTARSSGPRAIGMRRNARRTGRLASVILKMVRTVLSADNTVPARNIVSEQHVGFQAVSVQRDGTGVNSSLTLKRLQRLGNRVFLETGNCRLTQRNRLEFTMTSDEQAPRPPIETASGRITRHAGILSGQLRSLGTALFPPTASKALRSFSSGEVAKIVRVSDGYLRQLSLDGLGPTPAIGHGGRRSYTLAQINELRAYLAQARPREALDFFPRRRDGEKLQIITVANFKGGSAKTTTALYLGQYLALSGLQVLAIDLDPQASLSAMFGYQPEFDIGQNETIYGAIRYDDQRRSMRDVVRQTYFDGIG